MRKPSRSSGMGYQIRIEGDGAIKQPHGRPVYARLDPYKGKEGRDMNPTVVQCAGLDPYQGRAGRETNPTVVQYVGLDPYSG